MYTRTADHYDAIYLRMKDYASESRKVRDAVRRLLPEARTLLDVACGTGEHARHLRSEHGFDVDGIDLDEGLLGQAARKNPSGRFECADMTSFDLGREYDAVLCLFSAIGYARTLHRLRSALACFAAHARAGGVVLVEPWFAPGVLTPGKIFLDVVEDGDFHIVRMAYTDVRDRTSVTHFRYLFGTPGSIRHEEEAHELGLFTKEEMLEAFAAAGLRATHEEEGITGRGIYIARKA